MSYGMHVNSVIFGIYDINGKHDIQHMQFTDMLIWVSKEAQAPKECGPMPKKLL